MDEPKRSNTAAQKRLHEAVNFIRGIELLTRSSPVNDAGTVAIIGERARQFLRRGGECDS